MIITCTPDCCSAAVILTWTQRLDTSASAVFKQAIDELEGVESVEMYRYGACVDFAPHVTNPAQLGDAIALALDLALGPIELVMEAPPHEHD